MDKDNPHTDFDEYSQVVYWQNGSACGRDDEWTEAVLSCCGGYPELRFPRADLRKLEDTRRLMQQAFSRGRTYQAAEIRKAMNYQNGAA